MRKKPNSFVQELISYSSIFSKNTLNTCTSNSFPMVAYISNSWVSFMVHIKVIQILESQGILIYFDMHVSKYKVGTGIGTGKVWDVQLVFGEQSCKLGEWTTNTWSPILACTPTRILWVTKLHAPIRVLRQGMRCPTRVWCVIMQVMRCALWDRTMYAMCFYYDW